MRALLPLAVAIALAGCAAQPKRDLDFERLQADWRALDSSDDRARAPLESARVDDAIAAIQAVPKSDREMRKHLADMAELRIAIYTAAVAAARDRERLAALDDEIDAIHSDSVTEFPDESTHFQHWNLGRTHGLARQYRYRSPRR